MTPPRTHHLVDFASRYAVTRFKTLNTATAISRAEDLISDAEALANFQTEAEAKELYFGNIKSTFEIINYFAVGLVTCLEWHARSRLVDIMLFKPSCIQTSDVKKIADNRTLSNGFPEPPGRRGIRRRRICEIEGKGRDNGKGIEHPADWMGWFGRSLEGRFKSGSGQSGKRDGLSRNGGIFTACSAS
jgi:hypothetical protein